MPDNEQQGSTSNTAGEVVELDTDAFSNTIPNHPFAIVDFWAPWCAPCRAFAPTFAQAAKKHPDILFAKVNTDAEQGLASHFNIRSIPTLMVFRENVIVFSQPGALSAGGLDQVIKGVSELDMNDVRRELEAQQASTDASSDAASS